MSFNVGPRVVSATGGSIKRVGNYRIHTFPSEMVTDGLVLNLDAGDPRSYPGSGTTWTDLSGNGNTATGVGTAMPSYNNANGGSLVFDGTNDYIIKSTPSSLNFGSLDVSVFCWIKCTKRGGGFYGTAVSLDVDGSGNGILFYVEGSSGIFRTWVAGQVLNGSIDVADNQWHQVGIVKFGTTATQFVDGIQRSSFACGSSLISSPNLILGNYVTTSSVAYAYNGNLSQVTIHSRALSAAEIAQNYDALKVRYTSYTNTFTPTCGGGSGKVEVLCVAGGGGGGGYAGGAGGGAGGLLYNSAFTVSSNTGIGLTVGAGGTGGGTTADSVSNNGNNTSFSSLISIGGGKGGHWNANTASTGGSGGGGMGRDVGTLVLGGSGTLGQGNAGGSGLKTAVNAETGGGGGGAGGSGFNGASGIGGTGGLGLSYSISGVSQFYAGGGGGAVYAAGTSSGLGGSGVGGDATGPSGGSGKNGIPNTGSGGGGGGPFRVYGGNGSNGIIIVRYPATDYNVELLIVGGGGGGGCCSPSAGGGGGGLLYYSSYPVSAGTKYSVTVGAAGTGASPNGNNGGNSIFGPLVVYGGGGGAYATNGLSGGSGGGGGYSNTSGGSGVLGQGNSGGNGYTPSLACGGGGGAGSVGGNATASTGGSGGNGLVYSISGTSTYYAAGGAAGPPYNGGTAGINPSGSGSGSYGGGGYSVGGNGGSGIIIIAYQGPQRGLGGTVDTTSRPGYTLHTFTTTGTDFFIP